MEGQHSPSLSFNSAIPTQTNHHFIQLQEIQNMRFFSFTLISILMLSLNSSVAQNGIGIGNNNPQELLDVSGAIKIGGSIAGTADEGSMRWDGTNFQGYDGSTWVNLDESFSGTNPTATNGTVYPSSALINIAPSIGSYVDIMSINLPSAGTYLLNIELRLTTTDGAYGRFRLFSNTTGWISDSGFNTKCSSASLKYPASSWHIYTASGPETIRLRGTRYTPYLLQIQNDGNGRSKLSYIKLNN